MKCRHHILILASILSLHDLSGRAQSKDRIKRQSAEEKTMLEVLDRIEKTAAMTPGKAEELLSVKLDPVAGESDESLAIFRGHGGVWKEAELRLPRPANGATFVLVLKPAEAMPMKQVLDHYGEKYGVDQPNPSAGTQASFGYVYQRPKGTLRFSFSSFEDYAAKVILIDRMQPIPEQLHTK